MATTTTTSASSTPEGAWKALTDSKGSINWIMVGFNDSKQLIVKDYGEKNLHELKKKLVDNEPLVCAVKVVAVDEQPKMTSKRAKYVLFTFTGKKCPTVKKGLILLKKGDIESTFKGVSTSLEFSDDECPPAGLNLSSIAQALVAADPAHIPTKRPEGVECRIQLCKYYSTLKSIIDGTEEDMEQLGWLQNVARQIAAFLPTTHVRHSHNYTCLHDVSLIDLEYQFNLSNHMHRKTHQKFRARTVIICRGSLKNDYIIRTLNLHEL